MQLKNIRDSPNKDTLIWSKPNPRPQGEKVNRPTNNTEVILWFVVDPAKSKYNHLKYTDEKKQIGITKGAKDVNQNGVVSKKSQVSFKTLQEDL